MQIESQSISSGVLDTSNPSLPLSTEKVLINQESSAKALKVLSSIQEQPALSARELVTFLSNTFARLFPGQVVDAESIEPTMPTNEPADVGIKLKPEEVESVPDCPKISDSEDQQATKPFREFTSDLFSSTDKSTISEAKLQYGIISYQLYQKSPVIQQEYQALYQTNMEQGLSVKESVKSSLLELQNRGLIAEWEVDWVYSLSHRAAQLDGSVSGINSRKSEVDFADALIRAQSALVGINSGDIKVKQNGLLDMGWSLGVQQEAEDNSSSI